MKAPSTHFTLAFAAGLLLLVPMSTRGEQPPSRRSKPQVIYQLPRTSTYAATLHSQAKMEGNQRIERPSQSRIPVPEIQQAPERPIAEAPQTEVQPRRNQTVTRPSKAPSRRMVSPGRGNGNGHGHGHGHAHSGGHGRKK